MVFDEYGRPFIILRDQEQKERIKGVEAIKRCAVVYYTRCQKLGIHRCRKLQPAEQHPGGAHRVEPAAHVAGPARHGQDDGEPGRRRDHLERRRHDPGADAGGAPRGAPARGAQQVAGRRDRRRHHGRRGAGRRAAGAGREAAEQRAAPDAHRRRLRGGLRDRVQAPGGHRRRDPVLGAGRHAPRGDGHDHAVLQDRQQVQAPDGADRRGRRHEGGQLRHARRQLRPHQDGGQARRHPGRHGAHPRHRDRQGLLAPADAQGGQGRQDVHPHLPLRASQAQDQAQAGHHERRGLREALQAGAGVLYHHDQAGQGQRRQPRDLSVGLRRRGQPLAAAEPAACCALGRRRRAGAHCYCHGRTHRPALLGAHTREAGPRRHRA
ncbi:hypothetical protein ON010_g8721 [Phytophthora cinnamomi]|nr:hypothetical protein ON010_g8721 [Phytophthora cinnamomi]